MTPADRIAQLEEEVAYLRRELGLMRDQELERLLCGVFPLSPGQARILAALYKRRDRAMTSGTLDYLLGPKKGERQWEPRSADFIRQYVYQLRLRIPAGAIVCVGRGSYELSRGFRRELATRLEPQERAAA